MNIRCSQNSLGSTHSKVVLYLPNPPSYIQNTNHSVDDLIRLNGNHWRKIFTIFAKLMVRQGDWKSYRSTQLLTQNEGIQFDHQLCKQANWHLVAGKVSWNTMGFEVADCDVLDSQQRAFKVRGKNILLLPYLDYRQFPNGLIDEVRECLHQLDDGDDELALY